jgi:serine/threonine-protein kinase
MKGERWKRLQDLFEQASGLAPEKRAVYLTEACGDDTQLREEVESLLSADAEAGSFIGEAVGDAAQSLAASVTLDEGSRRIGAYQVESELGTGGMGKVFLAVRADDEYRKQVAIKLIRWGADDDEVRRRFLAERQILANLDHPYIARLLDGGTTDDGLPYVVMEHIDGEPIDSYCDNHELTTKERLQLFRRVCEAVQYAHGNLVVHRDVKPGNILVAGDGSPKLLDFGIAKLLDSESGVPVTRTQVRLMTPEYASPEQVKGEPVTTASDVYSLGVLLYELLTGHRPYRIKRDAPGEVERVICTEEPDKPSTAVSQEDELPPRNGGGPRKVTPESVSRSRRVTPDRLRKQLAGDLDNIVLMALRKEPIRRYASVAQFSDDIRRYLEGRTVQARKDTWGYRTSKFVRRHKAAITAGAAIIVAIAGLTGFYLNRLAHERDNARQEAAKAEQVAGFLTELFEVSDPGESRGNEVTARELLDRGAERIDDELVDQPEVRAALMGVIGRTYESLGLYDEALPLHERALTVNREIYGDDHVEVAKSMHDLASILRIKGEYAQAESLYIASLALKREHLPENDASTLGTLNATGLVREEQGDVQGGIAILREALAASQDLEGEDLETKAVIMSNLGSFLIRSGEYEEAEQLLRESIALRRELQGDDHPGVGITMSHLARAVNRQGRFDEAEAIHREQLEWGRRVLGDDHPNITTWMNNLATVLKEKGEYAEAEMIQRQVLERYRAKFGDEHPLIGMSYNNLANLRHDQGDFEEAEYYHNLSLELNRKLHGEKHYSVADNLNNIAALLADKGENARAAEYQRQVIELDVELLGAEHEYVAMDYCNLSSYLTDDGQYPDAEEAARKGYAMNVQIMGPDSPNTATCGYVLGRMLAKVGRYEEAEPLARESVRIRLEKLPEGYWGTGLSQTLWGEALAGLGRYEEAEHQLETGYAILLEKRIEGDRYRVEARERFAMLYERWGKPDEAAALPY